MKKETKKRVGRQEFLDIQINLVFMTKYRHKAFTKEILDDLRNIFDYICTDFDTKLISFYGEEDYVHLLIGYPPKLPITKLVSCLRRVSSRIIKKRKYPSIQQRLWAGAIWKPSYFIGRCSESSTCIVQQYLEKQKNIIS